MDRLLELLTEHREWVGYLAGTLATASFVPQVVKTLRERRAEGISLAMYGMFCTGVALWIVYGLLLGSVPMILANAVTLLLSGTVLLLKLKGS